MPPRRRVLPEAWPSSRPMNKRKGPPCGGPSGFVAKDAISGGGFLELLADHRAAVLALGVEVAVDQLDDAHRRGVAGAQAGLDDTGIAAVAVGVALRQHVEQLDQLGVVEQPRMGEAAIGEAALLGERD